MDFWLSSIIIEVISYVFILSLKYFYFSKINASCLYFCILLMNMTLFCQFYCFYAYLILSVIFVHSLYEHFSLSHSFISCLHLFIIYLCKFLYSVPHLGIVIGSFHHMDHFHSYFFDFFGMISMLSLKLDDVTKASRNISLSSSTCHFVPCISF